MQYTTISEITKGIYGLQRTSVFPRFCCKEFFVFPTLGGLNYNDIFNIYVTENNHHSQPQHLNTNWILSLHMEWWSKPVIGLICMVCIMFLFYVFNKKKQRIFIEELDRLQLEYKAANALLNPHFVFNAITNIQNLVTHHRTEEANEYLALLSRLIRQNMENLNFTLIPLEKELKIVEHYVHLQNLRFSGKIRLIIQVLPELHDLHIPPLLLHTFVENSIVHGYQDTQDILTIKIGAIPQADNYVRFFISDNGIGYNQSRYNVSHLIAKTSMGISMTRERLERLSKFYGVKYNINVFDLSENDSNGTLVSVLIYAKFKTLVPDP